MKLPTISRMSVRSKGSTGSTGRTALGQIEQVRGEQHHHLRHHAVHLRHARDEDRRRERVPALLPQPLQPHVTPKRRRGRSSRTGHRSPLHSHLCVEVRTRRLRELRAPALGDDVEQPHRHRGVPPQQRQPLEVTLLTAWQSSSCCTNSTVRPTLARSATMRCESRSCVSPFERIFERDSFTFVSPRLSSPRHPREGQRANQVSPQPSACSRTAVRRRARATVAAGS